MNEEHPQRSVPPGARKGRGATTSPAPRYVAVAREPFDDGWGALDAELAPLDTRVAEELAQSLITRNTSPDVPFTQSVNPYRGCEHGCIYCFARPSHAWLDLSPGLDFERLLTAKMNAAAVLREELAAPTYRCEPIAIGASTDAYQPVERRYGLTRALLEVMVETRHPCTVITKSATIERDVDLLAALAAQNLVEVFVSLTTLDHRLARHLEPRATAPRRRLETLRTLTAAGVPTAVILAPVIPALTDHEFESLLEAAADAGASHASYVLLRLPREVAPLFRAWLAHHHPMRAERVMALVQDMRGGRDYDSEFGQRMTGQGPLAQLLARRFETTIRKLKLARVRRPLDCGQFIRPRKDARQMTLF